MGRAIEGEPKTDIQYVLPGMEGMMEAKEEILEEPWESISGAAPPIDEVGEVRVEWRGKRVWIYTPEEIDLRRKTEEMGKEWDRLRLGYAANGILDTKKMAELREEKLGINPKGFNPEQSNPKIIKKLETLQNEVIRQGVRRLGERGRDPVWGMRLATLVEKLAKIALVWGRDVEGLLIYCGGALVLNDAGISRQEVIRLLEYFTEGEGIKLSNIRVQAEIAEEILSQCLEDQDTAVARLFTKPD